MWTQMFGDSPFCWRPSFEASPVCGAQDFGHTVVFHNTVRNFPDIGLADPRSENFSTARTIFKNKIESLPEEKDSIVFAQLVLGFFQETQTSLVILPVMSMVNCGKREILPTYCFQFRSLFHLSLMS